MNAQQLSKNLAQAGFTRRTWSAVKGSGRSRATNGFEITSNEDTIEVVVRHHNEAIIENVHSAVIGFGFQKVAERGSVRIYKATN
jgi:hypothetical protein